MSDPEMGRPDRDAYFHRVEITQAIATAIQQEVLNFSGETWVIEFTDDFWFRIIDKTDPQVSQDFGWFPSMESVGKKFQAMFPTLELRALTV